MDKLYKGGDFMGEIIYFKLLKGGKQMDKKTVGAVANFFLSKGSMSNKKLQKLVYYAYAWTLALLNEDKNNINYTLFNESIQAWVHGPVCPDLYNQYRNMGWDEIPKCTFRHEQSFSEEELDIMNQVWDVYGRFTGNELESLTHQEEPWIEAREGLQPYEPGQKDLNMKTIFKYYNHQASE